MGVVHVGLLGAIWWRCLSCVGAGFSPVFADLRVIIDTLFYDRKRCIADSGGRLSGENISDYF